MARERSYKTSRNENGEEVFPGPCGNFAKAGERCCKLKIRLVNTCVSDLMTILLQRCWPQISTGYESNENHCSRSFLDIGSMYVNCFQSNNMLVFFCFWLVSFFFYLLVYQFMVNKDYYYRPYNFFHKNYRHLYVSTLKPGHVLMYLRTKRVTIILLL